MAVKVRLTKRKGKKVFVREDCIPDHCLAYIAGNPFCSFSTDCPHVKDRTCPYLAVIDRLAEYEDKEYSK